MKKVTNQWLWPNLIAHRGAGTLAPENTLAAVRLGHEFGFTMMEFDVRFSHDRIPVLLHDDTLDRTSNGQGALADHSMAELMQLDFGSWHSPAYAGEPIPTLHTIAAYTQANHVGSNIEIKAAQGLEAEAGHLIATAAHKLWKHAHVPPLISSFSRVVLDAARDAAPGIPRAWLLDAELPEDWRSILDELDCAGLNLNFRHVTPELVNEVREAGYTLAAWTVNEPDRARQLLEWGCDAVVTDLVDQINPSTIQAKRSFSPR